MRAMARVVASAPQPEPGCFGGTDHEGVTLEIPRVGGSSPPSHPRNSDGDGFIDLTDERVLWSIRLFACEVLEVQGDKHWVSGGLDILRRTANGLR